ARRGRLPPRGLRLGLARRTADGENDRRLNRVALKECTPAPLNRGALNARTPAPPKWAPPKERPPEAATAPRPPPATAPLPAARASTVNRGIPTRIARIPIPAGTILRC